MYIPNDPTRYTNSSPGPRNQLFNNPVTCDIIIVMTVASFGILLLSLLRWLQSCIPPDDDDDYFQNQQAGDKLEEEALPLRPTPTADGEPLDNGPSGEYKTFYFGDGKWYKADGVEMSHDDWIEVVLGPLD
ncbi:hypothetical protein KVR01_012170 [Diaporthe batatas]|uniref:uncharacterized protein n=1 Tax=Diaporthe batatas TaxID=748121 RepID=UPI001D05250A|nr:uncharacterized protein KVR01_012170 [Diaporthe batatas]KAG8157898.1 hypothetical protein KVR01_012170 [Diaporthe batatas]